MYPTGPMYEAARGAGPAWGDPAGPAYQRGFGPTPVLDVGNPPVRLVRRSGGRIVGGVAGGLSDHLGLDVFTIRMVFVLLSALAGAGIVAYGLLWIFTPGGHDSAEPSAAERRQAIGLAMLGLGLAIAISWLMNATVAAKLIAPVVVVAVGAALVWREYDTEGPRSLLGLPARPTVITWARIVAGTTLVVLGLGVLVMARIDLGSLGSALIAVVVTLVGGGLLTVPLWLRMARALDTERAARIRNEEREEIASHLHDSVLQTLALIQRQAEDPHEVVRLARSQERELRRWLFEDTVPAHSSLAAALRTIAGEVEDQHGVKVTPVTVGDVTMDVADSGSGLPKEHFTALLGAAREAMVNAAKHAGVPTIDLFAEVEPHQVSVFVRDRGAGFDPATVPTDRQGLAKSIRGRIERRGGRVEILSTPGRGTEVRLFMPRSDSYEVDASDLDVPEPDPASDFDVPDSGPAAESGSAQASGPAPVSGAAASGSVSASEFASDAGQ